MARSARLLCPCFLMKFSDLRRNLQRTLQSGSGCSPAAGETLAQAIAPASQPTCPLSGHLPDKTQPHSGPSKCLGARVESSAPRDNSEMRLLSESDPTDHALATIASILDQPETPPEVERRSNEPKLAAPAIATTDGDGYAKVGPGPIAAIRFKWAARRASEGEYFVDETIGDSSAPMTSGPMSREAAIALVDERESEARLRFDQLRYEMTGRAATADLLRKSEA